ncbi:conserved hypothetical protein [delta proteobacterium NaphS2]|nr:conserved hypothetical protein [delta proteobacterium NaphS2]
MNHRSPNVQVFLKFICSFDAFFEKELHNALFQELSMPRLYEKRISSYTDIGPFNSNRELLEKE